MTATRESTVATVAPTGVCGAVALTRPDEFVLERELFSL